jgi:peptidoglycan/LPS O-acetylase OafA/YrhL
MVVFVHGRAAYTWAAQKGTLDGIDGAGTAEARLKGWGSVAGHEGPRLDSLTEGRFFAALGVVMFHAVIAFGVTATWVGGLSAFGFTGVSFFFALSGFVLTWAARDGEHPGRFYARRFARIYPIYALTWLAAVLYAAVGHGTVSWRPVLLGFGLLQAWSHPDAMSYNYPAWSLSDEAFFYALFPLLIRPVSRMNGTQAWLGMTMGMLWMAAGSIVTRLAGETTNWLLFSFPPYRLGEFVCGMCLAVCIRRGWRPRVPLMVPILILAVMAVLRWQAAGLAHPLTVARDLLTLCVIPVELLLIACLATRDLQPRRRHWGAVVELGNASYALYISHALVLFAWGAMRLPFASWYMPVYVVTAVVGSLLLHRWVERPAEQTVKARLLRQDTRAVPRAGRVRGRGVRRPGGGRRRPRLPAGRPAGHVGPAAGEGLPRHGSRHRQHRQPH